MDTELIVFTFAVKPTLKIPIAAENESEAWDTFRNDFIADGLWLNMLDRSMNQPLDITMQADDVNRASIVEIKPHQPFAVTRYYVTECTANEFIPKDCKAEMTFETLSEAEERVNYLNDTTGGDYGILSATFECIEIKDIFNV